MVSTKLGNSNENKKTARLGCGDGDYLPLVEYLQNQGKQVEVMAFGNTSSGRLREEADDFIDLGGEEKHKFLILERMDRKIFNPKFKK